MTLEQPMEVIVTILWFTVTRLLFGADQMLCRRRLDKSQPDVARLLERPAMFLSHENFTIGPFRRPLTMIALSLFLFQLGLLICGVVVLVGVATVYTFLTGRSVWDDAEGGGLKLLMGAFLLLGVACIPIAVVVARRTLRGGQVTLVRDGTLL